MHHIHLVYTDTKFIKNVLFSDVHNTMLNTTAGLAISINNLPPWEFDWNDNCPQKSRHTLTLSEVLPNAEDGQQLYYWASSVHDEVIGGIFPKLGEVEAIIVIRWYR